MQRSIHKDPTISVIGPGTVDMKKEMERMGVHGVGVSIMAPKAEFKIVKIKDVPVTSANILKQDILSFGGEAATAQGAINHSIKTSDVIIFATLSQLKSLIKKLRRQYFGLKMLGEQMERAISNHDSYPASIKVGSKTMNFGKRTYIMGILNVTPDSFSDGGKFRNADEAADFGIMMMKDGADIIDVGGESTRPGARPVSAAEEIKRVIPVIKSLSKIKGSMISIDTTKATVAEAAIKAGAGMINDVSGLRFDKKMASVAARNRVPIVVMHMLGKPRTMQENPRYDDLISDIISCLQTSITLAIKGGVPKEKIIIDPGFGFGKTVRHNLEILRRIREFKVLGRPIMIGTSRKSTIGKVLDLPPEQRVEGTAATVAAAIMGGANIMRVHDVKQMARVAKMCDAIIKG